MLSIDFWNILFTVINLLIFFLIIKFFLLKPIKKVMDKRQQMIQDDFDSASKAKNEAEELKAEYEGNIQSAKDKAAEITETAKRNAESHRATVIENANAEAKAIVEKAQKNAQAEYDKTISRLESEIADLALVAATKVVKDSTSDKDVSDFDKFLQEEQ